MNKIQVLDCTLRDGGRIIDCAFPDSDISDMTSRLSDAGIDIIEVGFLRNDIDMPYKGNTTFFTDMEQVKPFIPRKTKSDYVIFIDFGMYDFSMLPPCDNFSITGIRVGFTKNDYRDSFKQLTETFKLVKEKGYKLFIQDVNTLGYSDKELLNVIDMVNDIEPYAFAIVDTYGAMYDDDLIHYYDLLERNLNENICIDFHSHNNFQLSFSLAQCLLKNCQVNRSLIIDATLDGMGKCAGNLNTELLTDYLNQKYYKSYDVDALLDIIDDYLYVLKRTNNWGYSVAAVMAGKFKAHPNNVIYLTEKYRLSTKDIKYIIQRIDAEKRQRYDYENIRNVYMEYNNCKIDDKNAIKELKEKFTDKDILLLFPGSSINKYENKIKEFLSVHEKAQIISINFVSRLGSTNNRIAFFGSEKRYVKWVHEREEENVVCTSNIKNHLDSDIMINYESIVEHGDINFDNTTVMLFNLLIKCGFFKVYIAGLDGYGIYDTNYYDAGMFGGNRGGGHDLEEINKSVAKILEKYKKYGSEKGEITFLTPSYFEKQIQKDL